MSNGANAFISKAAAGRASHALWQQRFWNSVVFEVYAQVDRPSALAAYQAALEATNADAAIVRMEIRRLRRRPR